MNELLEQGLAVMGIGMGTVLLFLCIMILAMYIMSNIVIKLNNIFPEAIPQTASGKKSSADESEIAAAIVAAMFSKEKKGL